MFSSVVDLNSAMGDIGFPLCHQMLLPEGFNRDNGKMYEEVNIPSSTAAPTNVGRKLVTIAELDEVRAGI